MSYALNGEKEVISTRALNGATGEKLIEAYKEGDKALKGVRLLLVHAFHSY